MTQYEHEQLGNVGYLYISADHVRYEVIRPDKDRKHSFQISRSDITAVQQWVLLGTTQNAAEIKTTRAVYHFWRMPNEDDLQPGQPSRFNPRDAAAPDALIAALRDPSTVLANNPMASSRPSDQGGSEPSVVGPFAPPGSSDLVGTWSGQSGQSSFSLILNADSSGSLNGLNLKWQRSAERLSLVTSRGTFNYHASLSGDSLTLSGPDLREPLVFQRVKPSEPAGLFFDASGSARELPVPGNPPLTQEMVDKGTQFFEWLLDAQLTVEQRSQFRDSLVRSWKTHQQDEIDATLNVLKYADQLRQKPPDEQRLVREVLREKYLNLMQQNPNDPLSRWVLGTYYSAHRAIADGNPPLTSQVVDAYAEFVSFLLTECLRKRLFNPDRHFKDQLAQSLAATYSSYSAEQQRQFSQVPVLWEALRFRWARLSEPEREGFRQQWIPAANALLSSVSRESAPGGSSPSGSLQNYVNNYSEQLFVKSMCNSSFTTSMNLHLSMWR